jgi:hypothetical protein
MPQEAKHTPELGRYGHHPHAATDFCIEVERIEAMIADAKVFGHPFNDDDTPATQEDLDRRIRCAMDFRVAVDPQAVEAKQVLREIEIRRQGGDPVRVNLGGYPGVVDRSRLAKATGGQASG